MANIIAFGEVLWDLLPSGSKIGGAPLNVALHLRRQGIDAHIISKVGTDDLGARLKTYLGEQQLDLHLIEEDAKLPTSTVVVELDDAGHAQYDIVSPVAWDNIMLSAQAIDRVSRADAFVFGTLAARNATTFHTLSAYIQQARYRILDVNLRPPNYTRETVSELIQAADLVKMNDEELELVSAWLDPTVTELPDQMALVARHFSIETLIVTLGAEGAACLHEEQFHRHTGYQVEVTDTVGSGDSFLAAFIASKTNDLPIQECLNRACATGAYVATQAGANPVYDFSEIERIMTSSP